MKTYHNAAVVDIYVCGHKVDQVTSYWEDFATFEYSLPHMHFLSINITALCVQPTAAATNIQDNGHKNSTIVVKLVQVPQCNETTGELKSKAPFGKMQLFKLTAVSMC